MKKVTKRITAVGVCTALCLGSAKIAFAQTGNSQEKLKAEQSVTTEENNVISSVRQMASKDETVYVLAGADGSVQKIIVSDWIQNTQKNDTVSDKSDLRNIENVKGEESYRMDSDNMVIWDAKGNDIYYQGTTEKELPVTMSVSYQLDGKPISVEELAGKSGQVTIRFDYETHSYEMVELDGKQEKMYVPFAMLTGLLLDSDSFRNVEVSNGKLMNDGDHTIVIGLAFPGLGKNLALEEKIEIPDYVEITADVTEFTLGMTVTIATNEVFEELNEMELDSATDLTASMTELTSAMTQLIDGSSALYDGLCTLLEKSEELVSGVDQLAAGAKALRDGADSLEEGTAQVKAGLESLSSGLSTLSSNSESLNQGAAQVFAMLLSTANQQLAQAGITTTALTMENYAAVLDGVISSLGEAASSEAGQQIVSLKASLDSYNAFYQGLCNYTDGVDSAAAGAESLSLGAAELKAGTAQLKAGAASLYNGILQLKNGMPALVDGIAQLRDGSMELSEGLKQFNEQGIQKLADLVDGDLSGMINRWNAMIEVSEHYRSFSGIEDAMDGQVKFIYRTDEIK